MPLGLEGRGLAWQQSMKNAVGCGRSQEPPCRALPALALSLPPAGLFDGEGRPCVVRMELPLSAGEMVAALYGEHERPAPADLETDGDVWGQIAMGGPPGWPA